MKLRTLSTVALAAILGASAVNHLRNPAFYYPVVPPVLCTDQDGDYGVMTRRQWVVASAAPEALAAVGLVVPGTRKAAATATALMFSGFTVGHISALRRAYGPHGTSAARRVHAVRLPLQIPLIVWAWSARRP